MKKIIITVLALIGLAFAGGAIWLATMDGNYQVSRSVEVQAPVEDVWENVYNLKKWTSWSPWLLAEPEATVTYAGSESGVGSIYQWSGDVTGAGEIEHKEISEYQSILQEIRFTKPWESQSEVSWLFEKVNDSVTVVTWGMKGEMPFFMRWMAPMMEPWIGMDYNRGLAILKELSETGTLAFSIENVGTVDDAGFEYYGKAGSCKFTEISDAMSKDFGQFNQDIAGKYGDYGHVVSVIAHTDLIKDECEYEIGVIKSDMESFNADYVDGKVEGSKAYKVVLKGGYNQIPNAWGVAMMHVQAQKLSVNTEIPSREVYLVGPAQDSIPANWITEIYIPIEE